MLDVVKKIFSGKKGRFEKGTNRETYDDVFYRNRKNILYAIKSFGIQEVAVSQNASAKYVDYVYWGSDNLFPQRLLAAAANNNIVASVTEAYKEMLIGPGYKLA
ncbi:MAG: hypothetical protein NZ519_14030, partial [Bacteroidia bacterium]|nr:hypothetical protein [Bacteroidia bacterium]